MAGRHDQLRRAYLDEGNAEKPHRQARRVVRFTSDQRKELLRLGLQQQQVSALEAHTLALIAADHRAEVAKPATQDVRDELTALEKSLTATRDRLARANEPPNTTGAAREAKDRLMVADFDFGGDGQTAISNAIEALDRALGVVQSAEAERPTSPVRHRTASPHYVDLIYRALIGGLNSPADEGPIRPFTMRISAGAKQPFRRVVEVCYEVAGIADCDRALRSFITWRNRVQDVPEVSDVPSVTRKTRV